MSKYFVLLICIFLIIIKNVISKDIRLAVLKFGSVNWELNVIKHHKIDKANNLNIKIIPLTNKDATSIALMSNEADVIVTDWIWVNKQRARGKDFTFIPYSTSAGSLMVKKSSNTTNIMELKDLRVGIAGSSIDKSWLLLRAYGMKTYGIDFKNYFKPSYAAPPLINGLIKNNELDASFNYWNYTARLKANNYREILNFNEVLIALNIEENLPLIGYVFRESFANSNAELIKKFIESSKKAKQILLESNDEWLRIVEFTGAKNIKTLEALRDSFRQGIPQTDIKSIEKSLKKTYRILADIGGKKLVGKSLDLDEGTLWKQ